MKAAGPGNLPAVPIEEHEIVGLEHLAHPDPVALHPEATHRRVAQRKMTEGHIAMTLHFQDPASPRKLHQRRVQVRSADALVTTNLVCAI